MLSKINGVGILLKPNKMYVKENNKKSRQTHLTEVQIYSWKIKHLHIPDVKRRPNLKRSQRQSMLGLYVS